MVILDKLFGKKDEAGKEAEKIIAVYPEEIYEAGVLELHDVISPSALEISSNYLKLGEKIAKTIFVFSYPSYLSTGWFSPIINLDKVFDISMQIHPVETAAVMRQLQKKVAEVLSEIHMREEKGLVRDPMLDAAYQNLEELRDRLQQAEERLFMFGLYITIYADTKEELDKEESEIRSILESKLIYPKPALFQQKEGLESVFPLGMDTLKMYINLNTQPISSIFPFVSFDLTSNKGILYGVNRHNNGLILFDRFSLENFNTVVFGVAGGGKSILGSEPVLVKKDNKIQLIEIGPLVEKIIKRHGARQVDEELEGVIDPGLEVYSFNKNLKGEWSKVSLAARKKAPDEFYRFTTKSGREITTTADHNMIVIKDGKATASKSSEIKEGDFIPLPRSVESAQKPTEFINLVELLKNSKKVYLKGGQKIIQEYYQELKRREIDAKLDRYLYKYKDGQLIPMSYFQKILRILKIKSNDLLFQNVEVISSKSRGALPADFPITKEFLKIIGYIVAEGTITKQAIIISAQDLEIIEDISRALRNIGVLFYRTKQGIHIANLPFLELLKNLGLKSYSQNKNILPFIFNLDKEKIASHLSAYFEGDGGVEHDSVAAVSKSRKLISGIAYLLFYFGIIARVRKTKKRATNADKARKKVYWLLSISGQENLRRFAEKINFVSLRKKELLAKIIVKEGNTNVDIIPEIQNLAGELHQLFGRELVNNRELLELKSGRRGFSPQRLSCLINKIENRLKELRAREAHFEKLSKFSDLETIIQSAQNNKEINGQLWQIAGSTWANIKNQKFQPRAKSAFKILNLIEGNSYSLDEAKSLIYSGFKEMNLAVKHFNPSLQSALVERPKSDVSYKMIQEAGEFLLGEYQELLKKIPRIEEILNQFKLLSRADLFWDPIFRIEKFKNKKEEYVYDLTVDNEVFLAGRGGMFVHNSYFVKLEILRSLMFDTEVIVIDPEREYEHLAETIDGQYFNISLASHHHINPFDLPLPREDESPADILRSQIVNLIGFFRLLLGGLTPEEDSLLDAAITETYAARNITPDNDFSKATPPVLSDLQLVLASTEGGESLAMRLMKYTQGVWAGFLNQPTNVDMAKKFVAFSIRDMENELRPVAMFLITHYVWNAIRRELKKRVLIVDEAWWMMKNEDSASFLFGIAKRARKYYLGLTTITQDVGDFLNSPYGKPIITNSSLQLLMKQSPAAIDIVQQTFSLTEEEKFLLLESDVGEGLFYAGLKHVAIKIISSYTEDQIITTDPSQIMAIKKAKEEYEKI